MHEYYFANYRLLVDDAINSSDQMKYLAGFSKAMPATHTFTLHLGDEALLDEKFAAATTYPIASLVAITRTRWPSVPRGILSTARYARCTVVETAVR